MIRMDAIPAISIVFIQVLQNDDGNLGGRSRADKAKPTRANSRLGAAESKPGVVARNEQRLRRGAPCRIDCFFLTIIELTIIEGPQ
jgi:hypothetical protein